MEGDKTKGSAVWMFFMFATPTSFMAVAKYAKPMLRGVVVELLNITQPT